MCSCWIMKNTWKQAFWGKCTWIRRMLILYFHFLWSSENADCSQQCWQQSFFTEPLKYCNTSLPATASQAFNKLVLKVEIDSGVSEVRRDCYNNLVYYLTSFLTPTTECRSILPVSNPVCGWNKENLSERHPVYI